jgi:hypothetical protein
MREQGRRRKCRRFREREGMLEEMELIGGSRPAVRERGKR